MRIRGGHGPTLDDQATFLLAEGWGRFEPAIREWEAETGFPAPCPVEHGPRGGLRLAAEFAEWMMGFRPGWATGSGDRRGELRVIGNAVIPAQGARAIRGLMARLVAG